MLIPSCLPAVVSFTLDKSTIRCHLKYARVSFLYWRPASPHTLSSCCISSLPSVDYCPTAVHRPCCLHYKCYCVVNLRKKKKKKKEVMTDPRSLLVPRQWNESGELPFAQRAGQKAQKNPDSFFTFATPAPRTRVREKPLRGGSRKKTARPQP